MSNVETAYEFFLNNGFTSAQSAGIVGNLQQESGVNPESVQPDGPGRGIAQWSLGGRWIPSLMTGNVPKDLQAQENYILQELQSNPGYGLAALKQATTPTQAAQVFGSDYERYGIAGNRLQDAQQVFDMAQQSNWPTASGGVTAQATDTAANVTNATLDNSVTSDIWGAVKAAIGLGGSVGGLTDVAKIGEEIAAGVGFASQQQPQQLGGSTFLGSFDELLNPSITLWNPWGAFSMIGARFGITLLGMALVVGGIAVMLFGTGIGQKAIGGVIKGVELGAMA